MIFLENKLVNLGCEKRLHSGSSSYQQPQNIYSGCHVKVDLLLCSQCACFVLFYFFGKALIFSAILKRLFLLN